MGLQEIFNKLHNTDIAKEEFEKTNLSIHKVELGLIDDYNKRIDKADNSRKKAAMSLSKLEGDLDTVVIQLELANKEGKKVQEMAKELGIKSPINMDKLQTKLKDFNKSLAAVKSLSISTD